MQFLKPSVSLLLLVAVVFSLNTKFGSVPPLGKFFDPDAGFWANAEIDVPESREVELNGTKQSTSVFYDERRVPHIFAESDYDLYYAQGYVTAQDRLFQMELQTYDAAGRLSEIVGKQTLGRDKGTRRRGMPYGAEKAFKEMEKDPEVLNVLTAYADGANAYISSLSHKDYPVEYKILDISPEEWTPIKTAHLLKNMTRMLAGGNSDDRTSNTLEYFGADFIEKFFFH